MKIAAHPPLLRRPSGKSETLGSAFENCAFCTLLGRLQYKCKASSIEFTAWTSYGPCVKPQKKLRILATPQAASHWLCTQPRRKRKKTKRRARRIKRCLLKSRSSHATLPLSPTLSVDDNDDDDDDDDGIVYLESYLKTPDDPLQLNHSDRVFLSYMVACIRGLF